MIDIIVTDMDEQFSEILVGFDRASFTEEWSKNATQQISFSVTKTQRNAFAFDLLEHESFVEYDGEIYVVKQLTTKAAGYTIQKDVTATHISFTAQDDWAEATKSGKLTIEDCLQLLFNGNSLGFTWEVIGSFPSVEQENFGNKSLLDGVNEIQEDYGAIMVPRNKHLVFYDPDSFGERTENFIRYKYNTDDLQLQFDTTNLKTVVKGFGKQKDDGTYYFDPITYTSPNISKWGRRVAAPVSDERFTNPDSMLQSLKNSLQDYPTISVSVSLKRKIDVGKGDYWLVIYEPLGLDIDVQIVAYKKYPFINKPPDITLSNSKEDIINIQVQLARELKRLKGAK
jgi:Prophage endopeptidase tail